MVVSCAFVGRGVYVVFLSIPVLYMLCLGDPRHSDTASVALCTKPSELGKVSVTRTRGPWLRGTSSSLRNTMSSLSMLERIQDHFLRP